MHEEIINILTKVLTIINYTDDKDKFIDEFIKMCQAKTFTELFNGLPAEKQETLKSELTPSPAPEKVEEIFLKYFTKEDYQKVFLANLQQQFQEYLQSIFSTLSQEQIKELDEYFRTLQATM